MLRSVYVRLAFFFAGIAIALGWAGLVCLNSGEPDFTEQFWFYGLVAVLLSHIAVVGVAITEKGESNA